MYGGNMTKDKYEVLMRILDDQNRLTDRADTKAISLLTTLGLFTVIFISQLNGLSKASVVPFTVFLLIIYCISVVLAVLHIVMAISPRIRKIKNTGKAGAETPIAQPTFFGGICKFPDADAYKKCIDDLASNEESVNDTYVRQVYEVAKINQVKYKYVGRAIWFVVITVASQIIFIVYTFSQRLAQLSGQ
jgi:hypothetical protein